MLTLFQTYYNSLIDCHFNGNGEVDMEQATDGGKLPRCFYNGYVRAGMWRDDGTAIQHLNFLDF